MLSRWPSFGILLAFILLSVGLIWMYGAQLMLKDELKAARDLLHYRTAEWESTHALTRDLETRHQETEKRLREARRLAQRKAYEKLTDFLAALQSESKLQKQSRLYVVVSLWEGRLYVKRGVQSLKEYVISFGSGGTLEKDGRKWIFDTPRGTFPVLAKKENPVWIKPDWAFAEKNEPIPPPDSPKRRVKGDLGKFGIYLGDGYLIHGTPPEKEPLIGLNISHGCIRMVEQDLKEVFDLVELHTPVIIR